MALGHRWWLFDTHGTPLGRPFGVGRRASPEAKHTPPTADVLQRCSTVGSDDRHAIRSVRHQRAQTNARRHGCKRAECGEALRHAGRRHHLAGEMISSPKGVEASRLGSPSSIGDERPRGIARVDL